MDKMWRSKVEDLIGEMRSLIFVFHMTVVQLELFKGWNRLTTRNKRLKDAYATVTRFAEIIRELDDISFCASTNSRISCLLAVSGSQSVYSLPYLEKLILTTVDSGKRADYEPAKHNAIQIEQVLHDLIEAIEREIAQSE